MRVLLTVLFVFAFVSETKAQKSFHWRPGSILSGLSDAIETVASEVAGERGTEGPEEFPADSAAGSLPHPQAHHSNTHPQHVHSHHAETHRPVHSTNQTTLAVSIDDVIKMVHRGLGETTIVQHIADNGVRQRLNVNDLIHLHEQGVSEPIIRAMQTARVIDSVHHRRPASPRPASPGHAVRTRSHPQLNVEQFGPSVLVPHEQVRVPHGPAPRVPVSLEGPASKTVPVQ